MAEGASCRGIRPALFFMALTVFLPDLRAADFEYTVVDGTLFVFGYRLQPQSAIKASRPRGDNDTFIGFHVSPSERWVLVHVGENQQTELWLYDSHRKTLPVKVNVRPRGRHVLPGWRSDEVFEIRHAGMGYSESEFIRADDVSKRTSIDGHIYDIDFERGFYACFYADDRLEAGVELGRLFAGETQKERFPVNLEFEYVSDATFAIEQVQIVGKKLTVTHKRMDGTLVQETFSPELLKE